MPPCRGRDGWILQLVGCRESILLRWGSNLGLKNEEPMRYTHTCEMETEENILSSTHLNVQAWQYNQSTPQDQNPLLAYTTYP